MTPTKNVRLKAAIFERGVSQGTLAEKTGIARGYISLGLHGRYLFSEEEKVRIAQVLGKRKEEIF